MPDIDEFPTTLWRHCSDNIPSDLEEDAETPTLSGTSLNVFPGDQSLVAAPTGNAFPTYNTITSQGTTAHGNDREFLVNLGLSSNVGAAATPGNGRQDKVTLYSGIEAQPGSGNIWAINTVTVIDGGVGNFNAHGIEIDLTNFNIDYGAGDGSSGLASPVSYGLQISGAEKTSTSAIIITGATENNNVPWHRGIVVPGFNIIRDSVFQDLSTNAVRSVDIRGNKVYGVDMADMTTGSNVRLSISGAILARSGVNPAMNMNIIRKDSSDSVVIADQITSSFTYFFSSVLPVFDNTYNCGFPSNRWSAIWAANGVIQTSDRILKKDISPLPDMTSLLKSLHPKTFKWKIGGYDLYDGNETKLVHDSVWSNVDVEVVEIKDGKAVLVKRSRPVETFLYDEVPLVDEAGSPIMTTSTDSSGNVSVMPRLHRTPKMAMKSVPTRTPVEREGRRLHWGFIADEVKEAFDALSIDFGGYIKDEQGGKHLRPDELVAVLWKAVQELSKRVEHLESRR